MQSAVKSQMVAEKRRWELEHEAEKRGAESPVAHCRFSLEVGRSYSCTNSCVWRAHRDRRPLFRRGFFAVFC